LFSSKKIIFLEHNIKYDIELAFLKRPIERWIHLVTEKMIARSTIYHVCVTREIRKQLEEKTFKPKQLLYIQNGYLVEDINPDKVNTKLVEIVKQLKQNHDKLMVFIGNNYAWHGLDKIIDEVKALEKVSLIILGPISDIPGDLPANCHAMGPCNTDTLVSILECCDFGFGAFNWELIGITDGCPLKSREYLCYGLPIIVNYLDCATDFEALKPYVFDKRHDKHAVKTALLSNYIKTDIQQIARQVLAWDNVLEPVFECITSGKSKPR
jgi:glycosyltransferase involved in cell wall biosynthesis